MPVCTTGALRSRGLMALDCTPRVCTDMADTTAMSGGGKINGTSPLMSADRPRASGFKSAI